MSQVVIDFENGLAIDPSNLLKAWKDGEINDSTCEMIAGECYGIDLEDLEPFEALV